MISILSKFKIYLISIFICFAIAVAIVLISPSPQIISWLSPYICPEANYFFDRQLPVIALTIDDSPDDKLNDNHTLEILATLEKYQVHATFFIISSKAKAQPEIVSQIVSAGHEIGNHLTKDEPSIKLGDNFESELVKAEAVLSKFAPLNWFRPGGGFCNLEMAQIAKKHNYKIALGSVWSYDTHILSSAFSTWFILHNVHPGAIIILHDSDNKHPRGKRTVATLNRVIPQLHQRGYRFVTLTELDNISKL